MAEDRLQKIIARAGVASRRKAEALITAGKVRVNGTVVTALGSKANPDRDLIEVEGRRIRIPRAWTYILLNKPTGVVTTASDEFDRRTVLDLVKVPARIFPVGRLDLDAEGLLLLTNDGDLAAALTHPAGEVPKTYRVKVRGEITLAALEELRTGVELEDGPARGEFVHRVDHRGPKQSQHNSWLELTVTEGRNHLVKRMLEAVGYPVIRLRRMTMANLNLNGIQPGRWRNLRREELHKLKTIARAAARKRDASRLGGEGGEAR